jgi:hypothetical protein
LNFKIKDISTSAVSLQISIDLKVSNHAMILFTFLYTLYRCCTFWCRMYCFDDDCRCIFTIMHTSVMTLWLMILRFFLQLYTYFICVYILDVCENPKICQEFFSGRVRFPNISHSKKSRFWRIKKLYDLGYGTGRIMKYVVDIVFYYKI